MTSISFDIVQLIEKNPVTRLSKNYQNCFINKIKDNFNEEEQRLFVANFYCYLNFKDDEFIIELDKVWKWVGFSRIDSAKRVLEKNFKINQDYKIALHNLVERKNEGGYNKETVLMTIDTFKNFCMIANTDKAKSIRNYYIKMEKLVTETFETEMNEIRLQLQEKDSQLHEKDKKLIENRQQLKNKEIEHINDKKLDKHEFLLNKFSYKRCIYLGEIHFDNNIFIKLGSSENIVERSKTHKKTYSNFMLLDVFECSDFRNTEIDILSDINIIKNLYRNEINGHISKECVLLSNKFNYQQVVEIVKKYTDKIKFFTNEQLLEKQKLDLEKQKME